MLRLVTIDLRGADMKLFEAYESSVLPLLTRYGGRLEERVRAIDGSSETHLLSFPDQAAYERYLSDPGRLALAKEREHCGAHFDSVEVERLPS